MPKAGLEPACLAAPPPQDGVSANSTTSALFNSAIRGRRSGHPWERRLSPLDIAACAAIRGWRSGHPWERGFPTFLAAPARPAAVAAAALREFAARAGPVVGPAGPVGPVGPASRDSAVW